MRNYFIPIESQNLLFNKGPNLLCNLKGDFLGGTRADTVSLWTELLSLFGGDSKCILGCCCLKTSALGPVRDIKITITPTHSVMGCISS